MASVESLVPYDSVEEKSTQIRSMFDVISGRYDRMNRILSLGFDKQWRKKSIYSLKPYSPKSILDIASGTGDMAILMQQQLNPEKITATDLSEKMMEVGRDKVKKAGLTDLIRFEYQDCMSLTYPEASFDAVTVAFGVRNFNNLRQGIAEMYRVLRPGGHVIILELSTPKWFPMNMLYYLHSTIIIPVLGLLLSSDKSAYSYLSASVKAMPQGREMIGLITKQGFKNTSFRTFTGGVCTMYSGVKN